MHDCYNDSHTSHAIMTEWTAEIENMGHKLFVDHLFSSPELYDDLMAKNINCYDNVRPNKEGMHGDFEKLKVKGDDVKTRISGDLTTVVCQDKI
jgi:hypothetical protein